MIRKTKIGKRILAMLLCGMLTVTSVVPTMASEVSESIESQTEMSAVEDFAVDEVSATEETAGAEEKEDISTEKNAQENSVEEAEDKVSSNKTATSETAISEVNESEINDLLMNDEEVQQVETETEIQELSGVGTISVNKETTVDLSRDGDMIEYIFKPSQDHDGVYLLESDEYIYVKIRCEDQEDTLYCDKEYNGKYWYYLKNIDKNKEYYISISSGDDSITSAKICISYKEAQAFSITSSVTGQVSYEPGFNYSYPDINFTIRIEYDENDEMSSDMLFKLFYLHSSCEGKYGEKYKILLRKEDGTLTEVYDPEQETEYSVVLVNAENQEKILAVCPDLTIVTKKMVIPNLSDEKLHVGSQTVRVTTYEDDYYYAFDPPSDGAYILSGANIYKCGYIENNKLVELSRYQNLFDMKKDTTYYFSFDQDEDETETEVIIQTASRLDKNKTSITATEPPCMMPQGVQYYRTGIKYSLVYEDGKVVEGVTDTSNLDDDGSFGEYYCYIEGYYHEKYALILVDEKKKEIVWPEYYASMDAGKYTVGLFDVNKENYESMIAECEDYTVEYLSYEDFLPYATELKPDQINHIQAAKSFDAANRKFYYWKPSETLDKYYMDGVEGVDEVSNFWDDSAKDKMAYFYFYGAKEVNGEMKYEYDIDFRVQKEIENIEILKGKDTYEAYKDLPLTDWKLKVTYKDKTVRELQLSDEAYRAGNGSAWYFMDDKTGGSVGYVIKGEGQSETSTGYSMGNWLKPGKYILYISKRTSEYDYTDGTYDQQEFTITDPSWEGKTLTLGKNILKKPGYANDTYYRFVCDQNTAYTLCSPKQTMDIEIMSMTDENELETIEYCESYGDAVSFDSGNNTTLYFYVRNVNSYDDNNEAELHILKDDHSCQHEYEETVIKQTTCTESGEILYTCKKCSFEYQKEIPATGHKEVIVPGKAATCTEPGLTEGKKCSVCGSVLEAAKEIPATGHQESVVPGKAATCTEPGLTDGVKCSVCGTVLKAQATIKALGHDYKEKTVKEATCTETGERIYRCERCGDEYQEEIPATGHKGIITEGKAATCIDPGLTAGKICSVCGAILEDAEVIPALGHAVEMIPAKEATCTTSGLTEGRKCSVCGIILTEQTTIEALGHAYEEKSVTPATCTEKGEKIYSCKRCGAEKQEEIPATGHKEVTLPGKEATCTTSGLTEGTKCSVCGTILKEQTTIELLGHAYEDKIIKPATCMEAGERLYSCKRCDAEYREEIPATGHKTEIVKAKEATCTEPGHTEGKICSVCGIVLEEAKEIPAKGHAKELLSGKAATCTTTGLTEGVKCKVCGTILKAQTTIKAPGHSYGNWTTTKAATVVAAGVQTRTCTRCKHQETRALAKLPSSGTLNATNFPLKVKQSAILKVNGMAVGDRVASWRSANTAVAAVDGNGKVTGKKKGTTTITATLASGRVLTATVKVQTGAVKTTGINVNTRNVTLSQNQSFQLVSVVAPFTSNDKLSYKTSNKKVATVSKNGKITAKKAGKTTITVKAGKKSVKVTVNVIGVKTTGISVNTTQLNLKVKKKATLKAYVTPKNSSEKITYKSSNKKIATVDVKGKVTARKAGTATITVTSGSKSVKVTVIVTK